MSPATAAAAVAPGGPPPIDYPNEWPPGSGRFGPNERQRLAHDLAPHCDELLYGGARGGGKTDFALGEALRRCLAIDGLQGVFFRRTYKELSGASGAIPRLLGRIPRNVGRWNGSERKWTFFNGSTLYLSYLETLKDVQAWLGLELQLMVFDQVEQIEEDTYVLVRTSLRATGVVAAQMVKAGLRPASLATANPGGLGHMWVKRRFVAPFPRGGQLFRAAPTDIEPAPMVRCFVPAKLDDNPALDLGDPTYRAKLQALPADDRKAQLEGDWNVFKGARFSGFRTDVHVRAAEDLDLPPIGAAPRARGIDYGSDNPFVCLWGVRAGDDLVIVYREVWERGLSPLEQAQLILASEHPSERDPRYPMPAALDPSCWAAPPDKPLPRTGGHAVRPTGPPTGSIAWQYERAGLHVVQADNRRLEGAADVAARLKVRPDGWPRIVFLDNCAKTIETLPSLQRDPHRPEDVRKSAEDHWYDALRYLLGKLGFMPAPSPPPRPARPPSRGLPVEGTRTLGSGVVIPGGVRAAGVRRRGF